VIVEIREYSIRIGKMAQFIELYRTKGFPLQIRHLRQPVGFFSSETGDLCRFVHIWLYSDFEERRIAREKLHADPDWQSYVPHSHKYIQSMNVRFLTVLDFGNIPKLTSVETAETKA
jgi:hypothetical protein